MSVLPTVGKLWSLRHYLSLNPCIMKSSWATSHVILRRTNSSRTMSPSSGSDVTLHPNHPIYLLPCSPWLKPWACEGLRAAVRNVFVWWCLQIAVSLYCLIILIISYQDWLGLNRMSCWSVWGEAWSQLSPLSSSVFKSQYEDWKWMLCSQK